MAFSQTLVIPFGRRERFALMKGAETTFALAQDDLLISNAGDT